MIKRSFQIPACILATGMLVIKGASAIRGIIDAVIFFFLLASKAFLSRHKIELVQVRTCSSSQSKILLIIPKTSKEKSVNLKVCNVLLSLSHIKLARVIQTVTTFTGLHCNRFLSEGLACES